jgi:hypothetical protein
MSRAMNSAPPVPVAGPARAARPEPDPGPAAALGTGLAAVVTAVTLAAVRRGLGGVARRCGWWFPGPRWPLSRWCAWSSRCWAAC